MDVEEKGEEEEERISQLTPSSRGSLSGESAFVRASELERRANSNYKLMHVLFVARPG
jgi:hypothetical protein